MIEVKQYTQKQAQEWNDFIEQSRQGTFLFNRSYMDYHADRFQDASLMIYRKEQLYALLPANRLGDTLYLSSRVNLWWTYNKETGYYSRDLRGIY